MGKYAKDHHQKSFSSLASRLESSKNREGNKNGKTFRLTAVHRMNISRAFVLNMSIFEMGTCSRERREMR